MTEAKVVPGLAKHFVHDPDAAVLGALESTVLVNPSLILDKINKIVFRDPDTIADSANKISLICGGGSGHEPAWAGFVGFRFLTGAVAGTVFASPSSDQVKACIMHRLPQASQGTLVIVKNYTGDVLNFGLAVEHARAAGKKVEMLVVGDDVGVGREKSGKVGRRGLAGTVLVAKCCAALAEMGGSLDECAKMGRLVADNLVTVALSLSRTHVIGRDVQDAKDEESRLPQGTMELGMGIHNEAGSAQVDTNTNDSIKTMLKQLLDKSDSDRGYVDIQSGRDSVVLLMNNFGGVSNLELGFLTSQVCQQLKDDYGLRPIRIISGTFVGSLDGRGFSITLLRIDDLKTSTGQQILTCLDAPTDCASWPIGASSPAGIDARILVDRLEDASHVEAASNIRVDKAVYEKALLSGLESVIQAEPHVTKFDTIAGDGDCGVGLKRGAEAVQRSLRDHPPGSDILTNLQHVLHAVESSMDGTSGALYAIFINALLTSLRQQDTENPTDASPQLWANALQGAMTSMRSYTPATKGDRTLVDALAPFVDTLASTGSVKEAAAAAEAGAESTKGIKASLGRTVYIGGQNVREVPDPGAYGLAALFLGIANAL